MKRSIGYAELYILRQLVNGCAMNLAENVKIIQNLTKKKEMHTYMYIYISPCVCFVPVGHFSLGCPGSPTPDADLVDRAGMTLVVVVSSRLGPWCY